MRAEEDTQLANEGAEPAPQSVGGEGPYAPETVRRWRDEVVRLRQMIADQKRTRTQLIWILKVGAVVAIPTAYFHLAAPLGVFVFAFCCWVIGRYFSWGHLEERGYHLKEAERELRRQRKLAGLPERDESLYAPARREANATSA